MASMFRIRKPLQLIAVVAVANLGAVACSGTTLPCTVVPTATAPTITVSDAVTGKPICDATILVIGVRFGDAGQYSGPAVAAPVTADAALFSVDSGGPDGLAPQKIVPTLCQYGVGFYDNASEVTLQVSEPGYRTEVVSNVYNTVNVNNDGCHPAAPEVVEVKLTRTGS